MAEFNFQVIDVPSFGTGDDEITARMGEPWSEERRLVELGVEVAENAGGGGPLGFIDSCLQLVRRRKSLRLPESCCVESECRY